MQAETRHQFAQSSCVLKMQPNKKTSFGHGIGTSMFHKVFGLSLLLYSKIALTMLFWPVYSTSFHVGMHQIGICINTDLMKWMKVLARQDRPTLK